MSIENIDTVQIVDSGAPVLPLWKRISDAAWDVIHAYGDEDPDAPQRAIWPLQKLLGESVRAYAIPDGFIAVFFDAKPGVDLSALPGSYALAQVAGYVEAVLPDGTALVLKDRLFEPGPLPMSTEPIHKADHVFVDYWAGDSAGRSEVCAAMRDGRMFCQRPFEHHPRSLS